MSDLFCAANVIVARHGEATYDDLGIASDEGGWLTDVGRSQAAGLAHELAGRRVAAIWCSDMSRAVQTAEIVAAVLGVPVRVRKGLREASVGSLAAQHAPLSAFDDIFQLWLDGNLETGAPDAETGADVVRRMSVEFESMADQFRGETVLVVSHGASMSLTLPRLAANVRPDYARGRSIANCSTCELAVDADGWLLATWAGVRV